MMTDEEIWDDLYSDGYYQTEEVANDGKEEVWRMECGADERIYCIVYHKASLPSQFRAVMFDDQIDEVPQLNYSEHFGEVYRIIDGTESIFVLGRYVEAPSFGLLTLQNLFEDKTISEEVSKPLFRSIAMGLKQLHAQGYAHRNLNLTNLACKDSDRQGYIIGYSLRHNARQFDDCINLDENLRPVQQVEQRVDHYKNDVWSLGAIMLLTTRGLGRLTQFRNDNLKSANDMTEIDDCYEGDQRDLMRKMLDYNPSQRISMADIASHPWFNPQQAEAVTINPKKVINVPYGVHIKSDLTANGIEMADFISSGGYGKVYKVRLSGKVLEEFPGDEFAAMKVADLNVNKWYRNTQLKREIETIQNLSHTNIISLIRLFEYPDFLIIVMELAKGCLLDEIHVAKNQEEAVQAEERLKRYFKGSCEGLQYLHKSGFAHRDLKPENILITRNNEAALCDFSFSRMVKDTEISSSYVGTPGYTAPEIVNEQDYHPKMADCWSMGVIIYECLTGLVLLPLKGDDLLSLANSIILQRTKKVQESLMSAEAKELVYNLLCFQEKDRWSMERALKCPFFGQGSAEAGAPNEQNVDEGIGASRPASPVAGPSHRVSGFKDQGSQPERPMMYHVVTGQDRHVSGMVRNLDAQFPKQAVAEPGHDLIDARFWVRREPDARVRADTGFTTTVSGTSSREPKARSRSGVSTAEEAIAALNVRSRSPSQAVGGLASGQPEIEAVSRSTRTSGRNRDRAAHLSSPVTGSEKEPVKKRNANSK